jgi:pimeloyl-ACP methyl ester carboxylesterase
VERATLVVLPGLDGTDVFFRPFLASLPSSITPIVVTYPPDGHTYNGLLRLVRRAVEGGGPYYVLGSSFSGPLALMLAREERDRVRGIVLSATFLRLPQPRLAKWRFAMVAPVIWTIRAARRLPAWTLRRRDDPLRQAKSETWSRVPARIIAARARAIVDIDVRGVVEACAQPLLCVAYAEDEIVPRASADEILRHCPAAELVVLPGRHLAMHEDPSSLATAVARFIQTVEARTWAPAQPLLFAAAVREV